MKGLTSHDLNIIANVIANLDKVSSEMDANFDGMLYAAGASFRVQFVETDTGIRHTVTFEGWGVKSTVPLAAVPVDA